MRRPTVFFSFRSPFSWLALERLLGVVPNAFDAMEMIPYWEPDVQTASALALRGAEIRYAPMSKAKHLYILYDTRRQAAKLGLSVRWPVDVSPHWEVPHLAWIAARRAGKARPFYAAVVAARWQSGENICDPSVIGRVAESVGLPGDLAAAADDAAIRELGVAALERAFQDDVFGVPYFKYKHDRFWGLDRVDDFLGSLTDTPTPASETAESPPHAYDNDATGGCG